MDHPIRGFIDTSKHVFQLHGVNAAEAVVLRRKLRRDGLARELIVDLARRWDQLGDELRHADRRLMAWHRGDEMSRRLAKIPSLGPIGASKLALKVPDPRHFATSPPGSG